MRHKEALILAVALLAKRPDALYSHLLLQEQSKISEIYMAAPDHKPFAVAVTPGEKT